MFDLEKQIAAGRAEMFRAGIKQDEVLAELEGHLREHYRRLTATGISPEDAFASAIQQLGAAKLLKQEFSKVSSHNRGSWRNNPASLNILAAWFIIAGLNALVTLLPALWRLASSGLNWSLLVDSSSVTIEDSNWYIVVEIAGLLLLSSLALIGWGLLCRRNFARTCALGWARTSVALFILSEIYIHTHPAYSGRPNSLGLTTLAGSGTHAHIVFLCFSLPMISLQIISLLNIGLFICACYFLARPSLQKLFPTGKSYV